MVLVKILNDGTGDVIEARYNAVIEVNGEEIYRLRIENHNRLSGIPGLIRLLAEEITKEEEK